MLSENQVENIVRSDEQAKHQLKHFAYAGGWKKLEPIWNFLIKTKNLNNTLPVLESILSKVKTKPQQMIREKEIGIKNLI